MARNEYRDPCHFGFMTIHQPRGEITVSTMKVIDAWASSTDSMKAARTHAKSREHDYIAEHGPGKILVVRSRTWSDLLA